MDLQILNLRDPENATTAKLLERAREIWAKHSDRMLLIVDGENVVCGMLEPDEANKAFKRG